MTHYFTQHAVERAHERYALTLSAKDLWEILSACRDGRASLMQSRTQGLTFVWRWSGKTIIPVTTIERDCLLTFQPQTYFSKSARREHLDTINVQPKITLQTPRSVNGRDAYDRRAFKRANDPPEPDRL